MTLEVDYLIIGQGLAGSLLAWRLIGRGARVLVVDDGHRSASSTVAAGLINPVTGKRLVKTAGVEMCLPQAQADYRLLEQLLGGLLLVEKPMLRLFPDGAERERWQQRRGEPGYEEYLGGVIEASQLPPPILAPHGAGLQLQTAYLRTAPLLAGLRDWLSGQGAYREAAFAYEGVQLQADGVRWDDVRARRAIFCEGYKGATNPWFGWLPFQPAKGEFLTLRSDAPLPDYIVNAGRWLMPRGDGLYRVGASYQHEPLDCEVSAGAREMLLQALSGFLAPLPRFEVVEQQAGVRPTTSDRAPFIGIHPHHAQLLIFNGFGSKGSLLIPWHAARFAAFLCDGEVLPVSADIARYRGPVHD